MVGHVAAALADDAVAIIAVIIVIRTDIPARSIRCFGRGFGKNNDAPAISISCVGRGTGMHARSASGTGRWGFNLSR